MQKSSLIRKRVLKLLFLEKGSQCMAETLSSYILYVCIPTSIFLIFLEFFQVGVARNHCKCSFYCDLCLAEREIDITTFIGDNI